MRKKFTHSAAHAVSGESFPFHHTIRHFGNRAIQRPAIPQPSARILIRFIRTLAGLRTADAHAVDGVWKRRVCRERYVCGAINSG